MYFDIHISTHVIPIVVQMGSSRRGSGRRRRREGHNSPDIGEEMVLADSADSAQKIGTEVQIV